MSKSITPEFNETRSSRDFEVTSQLDTVFDCLRSGRRRCLLYYLSDTEDEVVSVEDIVEAVWQYETPSTGPDNVPLRQSIRLSMVHVHLPRLEAVGALDYDSRRGEVRFNGDSSLEAWLEQAARLELE